MKIFSRLFLLSVLVVIISVSCSKKKPDTPFNNVNPFIGTGGHGHTFPGATMPFGMVQLSPDTRKDSWDGCSGYHYSDSIVYGFSHTHLSGTGVGDYGDIRFYPSSEELKTQVFYNDKYKDGYGSQFSHQMEEAEPGYYATYLIDEDVYASLTADMHSGFHKYSFPKSENTHILLDLIESVTSEKILTSQIKIINDSTIAGYRHTRGWANNQQLYFYARFSRPFSSWGIEKDGTKTENLLSAEGDSLKAWFNFPTQKRETIYLKVGLSMVDIQGAKNNLEKEIPGWDFVAARKKAADAWKYQLNKVQVYGESKKDNEVFYTALYHSFVAPNLSSDIDGRYRAHNGGIGKNKNIQMHTVFSLWDTFRALHPLFTIVQQEKTNHLINSMLDMYKHDGLLPVWELAACETNCMIGYNAVPVITDAWVKGIHGFDANTALEAMQASAKSGKFGLDFYMKKGYIPANEEGESVSKTLEYAYDDWCIAEMAKQNGNTNIYNEFIQRAQYYKNIFDGETGFFRGKRNGRFVHPFDPTEVNFMLTEANTWQYNFFVPQDINTHIDLLGGDKAYETKLDSLFSTKASLSGRHQSDITGLIGQYAHGNEPSHHMAYLYNYVGAAWKTQKIVRQVMSELYHNQPDGLAGNEDCGQMSAWYVLSAMGFYPVTPGTQDYIIGSPMFDSVIINLENNKQFKIITQNKSSESVYIQSVKYNNKAWDKSYFTHKMIMDGGVLEFVMGEEPNINWGKSIENRPFRKIEDLIITPVPNFVYKSKTFENKTNIGLKTETDVDDVFIKSGKAKYKEYNSEFEIGKTSEFTAYAQKGKVRSMEENCRLIEIPAGRKITLNTQYSSQYTAGGDNALINMVRGGKDFKTGDWQGYQFVDVDLIIDLGEKVSLSRLGMGFLQDQNSWIFMPEFVSFEVSSDGKNYKSVGRETNTISTKMTGAIIENFSVGLKKAQKVRYIKVFAKNRQYCPEGHKGEGGKAWLFTDEVWYE